MCLNSDIVCILSRWGRLDILSKSAIQSGEPDASSFSLSSSPRAWNGLSRQEVPGDLADAEPSVKVPTRHLSSRAGLSRRPPWRR